MINLIKDWLKSLFHQEDDLEEYIKEREKREPGFKNLIKESKWEVVDYVPVITKEEIFENGNCIIYIPEEEWTEHDREWANGGLKPTWVNGVKVFLSGSS